MAYNVADETIPITIAGPLGILKDFIRCAIWILVELVGVVSNLGPLTSTV